jgi:hypothetical protein
LAAVALLLAAGAVLAVAQPGNLGGDDNAAPTTTAVGPGTTTTAGPGTTTTTEGTTTTTEGTTTTTEGTTTTTEGSTTTTEGSTTTTEGSTTTTVDVGGDDGMADTGGESMIGAGMGLAALALALRRLRGA